MIALSLPTPFTNYIFCDENESLISALETRVRRDFPNVNAAYVKGDCNNNINEILKYIPSYSKTSGVLTFCFVDPFALEIHFKTLQHLAKLRVDFLILIATGMAAKRNKENYKRDTNSTIDNFLDNTNWRTEYFGEIDTSNESFTQFITNRLKNKFVQLGYQKVEDFHPVRYRLKGKSVLLYHLAFFSKNERGNKFWDITKSYANEQTSMF